MKRICIFIPSLAYGGAERVTSYITEYLDNKGYEVTLIVERTVDKEYKINNNINKNVISNPIEVYFFLKKIQPDLVLIIFAPQLVKLYPILRLLNIPWITSERNDPNNFSGKKIIGFLYKKFLVKADGVVFQTHEAQKYYKSIKGKKKIIYNPINADSLPEVFDGQKQNTIVNVGRLHSQKNQLLLIESFYEFHKIYKDYILEIYGEGPLYNTLNKRINELGLSNSVFLKGSKNNVVDLIKKSKVFVLSSDFEGMPNAIIESLAMGIPTISTDCPIGGPKEIIDDYNNGILVPVGNVKCLTNALLNLVGDKDLQNKFSNSYKKTRKKFDVNTIMKEWELFMNEVLEESE